ncbi:unnamed protein product [Chondrus crispus]|uniref:Uncharacterized protein n=1 Tax=Chondrus crispus TaxID=2769 RepID=R7Q8U4_CHOCR|nr:unnamed protein product [Chondrus crispus]CDF33816.1 unnamed protein product [Chondrus crispus]|eukprot:XP_005713635.1 unnamed protein product [Chondrus crispus]
MASTGRHRKLADSYDSDDDAPIGNILTTAKAAELCPKPHRLIARNGGFTSLADLSTLSALDYIDLRGNALTSVEGISSNTRLKTLIVKENKLTNVDHILSTKALQILDISDNNFVSTDWLARATFAGSLVALVARGNQLVVLEGMASLRKLETIVLSNNQIEDLAPAMQLTSLIKLSASNNAIRSIPPSITNLYNLRELRLAHNRLAALPPKEVLARLSSLKILDIGHNRITNIDSLAACSGSLVQLNIAGNPVCTKEENFTEALRKLCPKLEIIDARRIAGGRRKLRVNRQRLDAGMPLEPERKFARPPSAYYVQKGNDEKSLRRDKEPAVLSSAGGNESETKKRKADRTSQGMVQKDSMQRGEPPTKKKQASPKASDEEDDDALDAAQFIAMATTKAISVGNSNSSQLAIEKQSKPKTKQKSMGTVTQRQSVEFGSGGDSKW